MRRRRRYVPAPLDLPRRDLPGASMLRAPLVADPIPRPDPTDPPQAPDDPAPTGPIDGGPTGPAT